MHLIHKLFCINKLCHSAYFSFELLITEYRNFLHNLFLFDMEACFFRKIIIDLSMEPESFAHVTTDPKLNSELANMSEWNLYQLHFF